MTISQRPRRAGSPVWRVLGRSGRALRNLHDEQMYAWERLSVPERRSSACRLPRSRRRQPRHSALPYPGPSRGDRQ